MGSNDKKTKKSRSRLGRGLGALIDQPASTPVLDSVKPQAIDEHLIEQKPIKENARLEQGGDSSLQRSDNSSDVIEISLLDIMPNPNQPRRTFAEEPLQELAESIKAHGLMQPIVVRRCVGGQGSGGGYELIAGERRLRASTLAGLKTIRAIVLDIDEGQSAQLALIENIQREDLNPIERARGFVTLQQRFGLTQEQVAGKVGISRPSVANFLRLLELDEAIQTMIEGGTLSVGHGKALLSCADVGRRLELAQRCAQEGWTVRMLEQEAARPAQGAKDDGGGAPDPVSPATPTRLESVLRDLEKRLSERLSTDVKLKTDRSGTKGKVIIDFYDLDHFDGLMSRLGVSDQGGVRGDVHG